MSLFLKKNIDKDAAIGSLNNWVAAFNKASGKKNLSDQERKIIAVARSITQQSIESLRGSEKHGHVWAAYREDGKICAILIGDDCKNELVIRLLVANTIDTDAKGSGTFLAQEMIKLAKSTKKVARTTPENAHKYWLKMGFLPDPKDPLQYILPFNKI